MMMSVRGILQFLDITFYSDLDVGVRFADISICDFRSQNISITAMVVKYVGP